MKRLTIFLAMSIGAFSLYSPNGTPRQKISKKDLRADKIFQGAWNTCRVRANATECWGDNTHSQLGSQLNEGSNLAAKSPLDGPILEIRFGYFHVCARTLSKKVFCWGRNFEGQSNPSNNARLIANPYQVSDRKVQLLALGPFYSCIVPFDGSLSCWGEVPQFLSEWLTEEKAQAPNRSRNSLWKALSASANSFCFIDEKEKLWCLSESLSHPVNFLPELTFLSVDSGIDFQCALTTQGEVYCWGSNERGQLGRPLSTKIQNSPKLVSLKRGAQKLSLGAYHTCVLTKNHEVECWGGNHVAQSAPLSLSEIITSPSKIPQLKQVQSITTGFSSTCALTFDGHYTCWGTSTNGLRE